MTDPHPPHGPSPDPGGSPPAADPALRRKADAAYRARMAGLPDPFEASWPEPARALVHELRVHQIELEMQNEELRRLQVELDATRARYFDLFDLAPVGYLLVREDGLILQANLTAAAMLGEVRSALTDRPVSRSIFQADQHAFYLCRRRLADTGEPQSCELRVVKPGGAHLWVLVAMSAACADDGTPLHRVTLTDIGESKRAEAVQRESEERLRVALTAAAAIGFVWDAASDAVVRYFSTVPSLPVNVDAPEPVAAVRARVHPDDVGLFDAGVAECLVEGTEYRNLYRVVDAGGSIRWLQEWGTLSRDAAGRPLRLTGISIDVTDRKRAEAALRASEDRFRLAILATNDAVWDIDVTNGTVHWSEKYKCAFGRPPETANSWQWWIDRIHPDDRDRTAGSLRAAMDGMVEAWASEYRFQLPNGEWAEIQDRAYIGRDPAGKAVRVVGAMQDVTAFRRSAAERDRIWNLSLDPMCVAGFDGYFKQVNAAWERTLGWTAEEFTSRPWLDFVHPDDRQATVDVADELIGGQLLYHFENRYRHKNGSYRWLSWKVYPLIEAGTLFGIARDVTEQKRAEAALRASEARFRSFMEFSPILAWIVSPDGRFLFSNHGFARLLKTSTEEVERSTVQDMFPPEYAAEYLASNRRVLEAAAPIETTERSTRQDGTEGAFLAYKFPVPTPEGSWQIGGLAVDITEQMRAEAALRQSEERLRLALEAGRMGIFDWDLATNAIVWSDTHYELFGYPPGELFPIEYHHFADRVHPDDLPAVKQAIRTAMEQHTTYKSEHRLLLPDGIVRWNLGTGEFQYDSDGRPVRMLGIVSDITDRKQAEEALRASEARARTVINSSPVPLALNDHAQRITFLNLAFTRTFGYELSDIPTLADWWPKAYPDPAYRQWAAEAWQAELTRSEQTGTAFGVMDLTIRCKDGTDRFVEANAAPLADTFAGTHLVMLHDITERKRADADRRTLEDQLRQAQKMEAIGRLAGGVAHDFNNLLTVINCYSEIALSETETGHPLREPMVAIRDAGERAANLTQQLLAFSRRAIVALRVLDLNDVVASISKMLRRLIGEDIAFATVLCPTPCQVRIDPGQIEQMIMNLAINARDAMPNGGELTIETNHEEVLRATPDYPPGRYVRLVVTDTGTGMTEDVKARIFEPFFTTKEVGMGTGLGLATAFGIVKQAGGHIRVESTIGKGTTFEVMFPEPESSVKDKPSDSIQFAPRGSETILLAEDEDAVRKVTRLGLEMQGYTVIETGTGAEAIATAASYPGPIQLLVTDVIMPKLGGRELADAIRANRPGIRVLYVSGYTSDALVRHGVEQGVDSFLQKPFTALTLARKVRMVLDAPRLE